MVGSQDNKPVRMYTTDWCPDCWRAKRFLKANRVAFEEINIDHDREAAQLVMEHNQGQAAGTDV